MPNDEDDGEEDDPPPVPVLSVIDFLFASLCKELEEGLPVTVEGATAGEAEEEEEPLTCSPFPAAPVDAAVVWST